MRPNFKKFQNPSIFVYEKSGTENPRATMLNRSFTTGHNLFYSDLVIIGSINQAGTCKFKVNNSGGATADERALFEDTGLELGSSSTPKYVVIICGSGVIWSGQILRSTSSTNPMFTSVENYCQWSVECESDVGKMKLQGVNSSYFGTVTDKAGVIVSRLVMKNLTDDIDWNGSIKKGMNSTEGATLTYRILDTDMYSQFVAIAKVAGFEWRTRPITWIGSGTYVYSAPTATVVDANISYAGFTANGLIGEWVIFLGNPTTGADSGAYVTSYARIASNSSSGFTANGVVNPTVPPATACKYLIILDPVLDFSWGMEQEFPIQLFKNNAPRTSSDSFCTEFADKTDKKMIASRVSVKAKNVDTSQSMTGRSESISTTLYANCEWEPEATMFKNTTFVSWAMDGYVYSYTANSTTIKLIGRGYALQANDIFDVFAFYPDNTSGWLTGFTISTVTMTNEPDGTRTTTVVATAPIHATNNISKYSLFTARKVYVDDPTRLFTTLPQQVYLGGVSGGYQVQKHITTQGFDTVYGYWLSADVHTDFGSSTDSIKPILPGCFACNKGYGDAPDASSPLAVNGERNYSETVDQATTLGDLEVYATQMLINHSFYLKKASFVCLAHDFIKPSDRFLGEVYDWMFIREGDRIAVQTLETLEDLDGLMAKFYTGEYKYFWEVMSWRFDATTMQVFVELGDFEPNVYTLLKTKTASIDMTIT